MLRTLRHILAHAEKKEYHVYLELCSLNRSKRFLLSAQDVLLLLFYTVLKGISVCLGVSTGSIFCTSKESIKRVEDPEIQWFTCMISLHSTVTENAQLGVPISLQGTSKGLICATGSAKISALTSSSPQVPTSSLFVRPVWAARRQLYSPPNIRSLHLHSSLGLVTWGPSVKLLTYISNIIQLLIHGTSSL